MSLKINMNTQRNMYRKIIMYSHDLPEPATKSHAASCSLPHGGSGLGREPEG